MLKSIKDYIKKIVSFMLKSIKDYIKDTTCKILRRIYNLIRNLMELIRKCYDLDMLPMDQGGDMIYKTPGIPNKYSLHMNSNSNNGGQGNNNFNNGGQSNNSDRPSLKPHITNNQGQRSIPVGRLLNSGGNNTNPNTTSQPQPRDPNIGQSQPANPNTTNQSQPANPNNVAQPQSNIPPLDTSTNVALAYSFERAAEAACSERPLSAMGIRSVNARDMNIPTQSEAFRKIRDAIVNNNDPPLNDAELRLRESIQGNDSNTAIIYSTGYTGTESRRTIGNAVVERIKTINRDKFIN